MNTLRMLYQEAVELEELSLKCLYAEDLAGHRLFKDKHDKVMELYIKTRKESLEEVWGK